MAAVVASYRQLVRAYPTGGGDYYYRTISRLGPGYIRLVFEALDNQVVTYPTASTLLDNVRVNNFDQLREYVGRRG